MEGHIRLVAIYLVVITFGCSVVGEIHRAKHTAKVVSQKSCEYATSVGQDPDQLQDMNDNANTTSTLEVWIYSIVATFIVGLCGVFPLLVVPFLGERSNDSKGTPGLGLLLSFAVGGLLGDVFLHLLPEAWAHVDEDIDEHAYHRYIGFWVLAGIISFLVLEKIFSDKDGEDSESDATTFPQNSPVASQTHLSTETQISKSPYNLRQRHHPANGVKENGKSRRGKKNKTGDYSLQNGFTNHIGNHVPDKKHKQVVQQPVRKEKIKVTGYLNLLANCIDNFTHGLAVAASFLVSTKMGILTTAAIMLHEIPHEIGDFAILLRSGFERKAAAKAQVMTATGGLVGAVVTLLADSAKGAGDSTVWVLPFTSGGFIYIAMVTVVPDLLKEKDPLESFKQVICLCSGIAVMALVTLVVE